MTHVLLFLYCEFWGIGCLLSFFNQSTVVAYHSCAFLILSSKPQFLQQLKPNDLYTIKSNKDFQLISAWSTWWVSFYWFPFESTLAEFEPLSNQVATAFAVLCLWHLDSFLHVEGAEHLFLFCVHMHTPVPQFHEQGTQNMSTDLFRDSSWTAWLRRCSISGCCIVDFRLQLMPLNLGKATNPGNVSQKFVG